MPEDNKQDTTPTWYSTLPSGLRSMLQVGFAGLIALMFFLQSREQAAQLRDMQTEARVQAREDRMQAREDLAAFRDELRLQRDELRAAVVEMKRAIDLLGSGQSDLRKDVMKLKSSADIPFPRPKPAVD